MPNAAPKFWRMRGAKERLGRLLLQLAKTRGHSSPGAEQVTLHISHDELAQMAAMNRSHVTTTMGKLRDYKLVQYDRNQPLRVNVPALCLYLDTLKPQTSFKPKKRLVESLSHETDNSHHVSTYRCPQ